MSTKTHLLSLVAALLLAASIGAPADAQRGRSGGGDHNRGGGGDHNRGGGDHRNDGNRGGGNWNNNYNDWDRHDYDRNHSNLRFSFSFGSPFYSSYDYYRPYYRYSPGIAFYSTPGWSNAYGLGPYECRVDYEFGYWYGRPADIEVRRCADAYGSVYVVQGSQRLWRYR